MSPTFLTAPGFVPDRVSHSSVCWTGRTWLPIEVVLRTTEQGFRTRCLSVGACREEAATQTDPPLIRFELRRSRMRSDRANSFFSRSSVRRSTNRRIRSSSILFSAWPFPRNRPKGWPSSRTEQDCVLQREPVLAPAIRRFGPRYFKW